MLWCKKNVKPIKGAVECKKLPEDFEVSWSFVGKSDGFESTLVTLCAGALPDDSGLVKYLVSDACMQKGKSLF